MSNLSNDNYIVWRFICRTFLFALLPALLFLTAYEIAYRNIPNSYSLKKEYLDRCADSIDILILGSSHAFYGVNPEYFSLKAFNAANVSQSFDYDARIYNAYFKGERYPDYLILSVSAFSFWERLESTDEHWRSRKYSIYMGFGSWRDWFSPDGYEFQLGDRTVLGYYVLGKDFVGCSDAGFGTIYRCGFGKDLYETGVSAAVRHSLMSAATAELCRNNIALIGDIIDDCAEHGKKVFFLITPTYIAYREALPAAQVRRTHEVLDSLHGAYPDNTAILDFSSDGRFAATDFYDGDHLCTDGAAKLSVILNDTLPKVFNRIP